MPRSMQRPTRKATFPSASSVRSEKEAHAKEDADDTDATQSNADFPVVIQHASPLSHYAENLKRPPGVLLLGPTHMRQEHRTDTLTSTWRLHTKIWCTHEKQDARQTTKEQKPTNRERLGWKEGGGGREGERERQGRGGEGKRGGRMGRGEKGRGETEERRRNGRREEKRKAT